MEFKQHSVYKQFYCFDGNKNILVFIKDYQEGTIAISKLIDVNFKKKFVILFSYDGYTDTILENSNAPLNTEISSSFVSGFNWIEDFGIDNTIRLKNKPELKFKINLGVLIGEFSNFRFNNQFRFNTNGNKPLIKILDGNISLESTGDIELICDDKYLSFKKAKILLGKTDCGCLSFTNERKEELIQPVSQYISSSFNILATHLFDKKQYDRESEIEVYYFPYPQKSALNHSESNPFQTRFELKNKPLRANIIDKLAQQIILNSPVKAVVGFTEYKDGGLPSEGPFYHFMPYGEVAFKSNETNFKIGVSGTESINSDNSRLVLNFKKNAKVKVNKDENDLEPSLNSVSTTPIIKYQLFNVDSEKAPIFKNKISADIEVKQIDYDSIPFASVAVDEPLPIIPTLSFKDNPEFFELEEVFKKIRLKAHQKTNKLSNSTDEVEYLESAEDYITPQGFQRNKSGYDFISKEAESKFQFSLENIDTNLDLSLRKDQVFFALTPALFKKYCDTVKKAKLNARFAINKDSSTGDKKIEFVVDLTSSYYPENPNSTTHSESIVLFKFHREKLSNLIGDLKFWTNEGLLNDDLKAIQTAINENKNFNDDYFTSILNDENWNGVLILNIPISNSENLPKIFKGVSSSQKVFKKDFEEAPSTQPKIQLETKLKFQYAAFPVNKTFIEPEKLPNGNDNPKKGKIEIKSTSFYGLIDYNPFANSNDYTNIKNHFKDGNVFGSNDPFKFVLSKLKVCFANSSIKLFESFAFLQVPNLFDDSVKFDKIDLANAGFPTKPVKKSNLIRLNGSYQKNSTGGGEISFQTDSLITITLPENDLIESIKVSKLGFNIEFDDPKNERNDKFRFDINSEFFFKNVIKDLFSFDKLQLNNVGLKFDLPKIGLPKINFDLSKLLVIPNISFNGNGFLRSFPIRFSHFKTFEFENFKLPSGDLDFKFPNGDFDFFKFPKFQLPNIDLGIKSNLFSFVFDFDLGTLGNLGGLKGLKGQLLIGWTSKGGFAIGFKLNGPSTDGLHLNLFGALKLDVKELSIGRFNPKNTSDDKDCTAYFLRLNEASLTALGTKLPKDSTKFNGIIITDFQDSGSKKIAWLINLSENKDKGKLLLGLGQRSGPSRKDIDSISSTSQAIEKSRNPFEVNLKEKGDCKIKPDEIGYQPDRNWFIASEDVMSLISEDWSKTLDIKFIFNDPTLYGLYLGFKGDFLKGFGVDILYKKISDSSGVYSTEIQLPDALRNRELGGASLRLPNIGIEIYTNGDWKGDIGFPKNGNDWSRSGFIQLRTTPPFVGWFGFYIMKSQVSELTLFGKIPLKDVNIIQAGFAMRVGLGAYIDGGIFYVGASISVYGILEGAFAFKKQDKGLSALFPDHFAVLGRVGAIAELVGYVNFVIIKASIYISLRAEFGLLLIYLGEPVGNYSSGLQPVKVYVEGEVLVAISVTLFCVKFFGKRWCLVIHLSFRAYVRFEYTIGGSDSSNKIAARQQFKLEEARNLKLLEEVKTLELLKVAELPMVFIPTFTRIKEADKEETILVNNFYIPFFGVKYENDKLQPSKTNIFKDKIIQPFLSDLLIELNKIGIDNSYEAIRKILLDGEYLNQQTNIKYTIKIKVPNYRPKFIDGVNNSDNAVLTEILKKDFGFEIDEANLFIQNEKCNVLSGTEINKECPYRAISAPISKNIKVNDNEINGGFDLKIEELVLENGVSTVNSTVNDLMISQVYLDKLEEYFNDYKTQFINRTHAKFKAQDVQFDLRENFLIPEFFKLATLLTLEKSYSVANPKAKKGESYNPFIKVSNGNISFSTDNTTWKEVATNDSIEGLIGQLNYFYNSGLRLPKDENIVNEDTIAINSLIEQAKTIKPIDKANRDWSKTKISIAGHEITSNIYGIGNDKKESVEGIWKFVDSFENSNGFDFSKLKNEFEPLKFIRPYKLINVTLGIQSNHKKVLHPDNSEIGRFYEIPKKLFQHGSSIKNDNILRSKFSFELTAAKYENSKGNSIKDEILASSILPTNNELEATKCLNIEIQVKQSVSKSESGSPGKVVFELNNVLADDLTLITLLKDEKFDIENISFYGKVDENEQTKLIKLTNTGSTIIKTNLSPRTSPPIFDPKKFKKAIEAVNLNQFVEDSNNSLDTGKQNFTKLVWEALTTNSGGYYLTFDNTTEFPKDLKEIVVSFESKQKEIPYFFNTLNIKQNKVVFEGLDKNELYLYIEQLNQDKEPVLEYHPTIPSHDFGFEVIKSISNNENYQQYLPLEFGLKLKGAAKDILSKNKILPIMPSNPTKDVNDKKEVIDNEKVVYSHISPLITDVEGNDINNIKRYSTVGKEYKLKLGLRDIYGFRTSIDFDEKQYKHLYFDKLIHVEAWPLIKFSYWFKEFDKGSNSLHWALKGYYDIREILDLAGIPKDANNNYKYDFGKSISDDDLELIGNAIEGVYNTLHTILAQLVDAGNSLSISNYTGTDGQTKIKDKIQSLITDIDSIFKDRKMPYIDSKKPIEFTLTTSGLKANEIESEISFEISLNRNKNTIKDALDNDYTSSDVSYSFKDLESKVSIWEYEAVEKVSTRIQASNGDDGTSNLKSLNKAVRDGSKEKFCLSISSNKNLERVLFLTNEESLKKLKIKQNYLENDGLTIKKATSYLGIKPISNKLWFGSYEFNSNTSEFSNIDLDGSLRIVLEKIDALLDEDSISSKLKANNPTEESNHKILFEKLITAKKAISIKILKEQVDWVIQEIEVEKTKAKDEFKEITLNKLTNFYTYDGVVSSEIDNAAILKGHRLNISLDSQKNYNLISSKITDSGRWNIFFDQEEALQDNISFSIKPKITHIELGEFGENGEEIRNSQWLQIIDPIEPSLSSYNIDNWTKIIREFPLKPVITKHEAVQSKMLNENEWSIDPITKLPDAGKWEYLLSIEDRYEINDQIDVKLVIKNFKMFKENLKSFEGFVSYWATEILKPEKENTFKWEEFVEDISTLNDLKSDSPVEAFTKSKEEVEYKFVIQKETKDGQPIKWKIINTETNLPSGLRVGFIKNINDTPTTEGEKPDLKIDGFNLFDKRQQLFSITPIVKAQRNQWTKNKDYFKYETDEVQPVSPATPLIKHYKPLGIGKSDTFLKKVFEFKNPDFPFKATAKYLVDIDANFPRQNAKPLPVIPIKQIESEGKLPDNTDEIFSEFDKTNGYLAFTYTIYNKSDAIGDLPIFYAETIFKKIV